MNNNIQFSLPKDSTPIDDFSGLKIQYIESFDDLNRFEGENIFKAYKKHFKVRKIKKLDLLGANTLKNIHIDMFGDVWDWAGVFRKTEKSIGVSAHNISIELYKLKLNVEFWQENEAKLSLLLQTTIIHHRLVYIHPFENGNGRFARFVSDMYLFLRLGRHFVYPRDLGVDSFNRKIYIAALRAVDKGSYSELLEFLETKCLK